MLYLHSNDGKGIWNLPQFEPRGRSNILESSTRLTHVVHQMY